MYGKRDELGVRSVTRASLLRSLTFKVSAADLRLKSLAYACVRGAVSQLYLSMRHCDASMNLEDIEGEVRTHLGALQPPYSLSRYYLTYPCA